MKRDLSLNVTNPEDGSYPSETKVCESILAGSVILFLTLVVAAGAVAAVSVSWKKEPNSELVRPTGQITLSENSTTTLYVVQSGQITITP